MQLPMSAGGLESGAVYISTEGAFPAESCPYLLEVSIRGFRLAALRSAVLRKHCAAPASPFPVFARAVRFEEMSKHFREANRSITHRPSDCVYQLKVKDWRVPTRPVEVRWRR